MTNETGRRAKRNKPRFTRRKRKWLYGIALAVLPILTAAGIVTETMAALYATLLGTILVPWLALNDQVEAEIMEDERYLDGVDDGYQVGTDHIRDVAEEEYNRGIDDSFKPYNDKG